jgi:hypothetical protein
LTHFYEKIEQEIDFQYECGKLESMLYTEPILLSYHCLYDAIELNFRKWEKRGRYASFAEMRRAVGMDNGFSEGVLRPLNIAGVEEFVLYCEMIASVLWGVFPIFDYQALKDKVSEIVLTIDAVLSEIGMERKLQDGWQIIVEKNAVATEVADKNPEVADVIIEYNQYLLKDNLERKRIKLLKIVHALDPKRAELSTLNRQLTNDFFGLANNANIRHNNVTPDYKDYNPKFAKMSDVEKENIYDLTYEQALMLFMLLGQPERDKKCKQFFAQTA